MKKLFHVADEYLKTCNWKDLTLIKFCLIALGIVIGLLIPIGAKRVVLIVSLIIFLVSYVPVMTKFIRFLKRSWHK